MNIPNRLPLLTLLIMLGFVVASPALADPGGHGRGNGHGHGNPHGDSGNSSDTNVVINIGKSDRSIIQGYIANEAKANCPPGLAKKHNGCLPPGQAKKLYTIGQPLSGGIGWQPIPQSLLVQLHPKPGYQYIRVDKDVLLISQASHKVVDAITLLSAVGK